MLTAFFRVSPSSATEEGRAAAASYVEAFIEDTGWHTDRIGQFGDALRYSEYSFLKAITDKPEREAESAGCFRTHTPQLFQMRIVVSYLVHDM